LRDEDVKQYHVIPSGFCASATASYSFALSEMRRVVGLTICRCSSAFKNQRMPYIARSIEYCLE
jgi:hypothetical protein